MSKRTASFKARDVPMATFGMFGEATSVAAEPAATMAQRIPDTSIAAAFVKLSKESQTVRMDMFHELIDKVSGDMDRGVFELMIRPACAILRSSIYDYFNETRALAVKLVNEMTLKMDRKEVSTVAGMIFPAILHLVYDSNATVSGLAQAFLKRYFATLKEQQAVFSKMRREIAECVRSSVKEIEAGKWKISKAQKEENWGRICGALLNVSAQLIRSTEYSADVFAALGKIPVFGWLKPRDGAFSGEMSPVARAGAYTFLAFLVKGKFMEIKGSQLLGLVGFERNSVSQHRLLGLLKLAMSEGIVTKEEVREALLNNLELFYDPVKTQLGDIVAMIDEDGYLQKCVEKVMGISDRMISCELFQCFMQDAKTRLPVEFLLELFKEAVSSEPKQCFFAVCPLEPFSVLQDDERAMEILKGANESRAAAFLQLCGSDESTAWLEGKAEITAGALIKGLRANGTQPVRKVWPTMRDIPMKVTNVKDLVDFVLLFARSEEIPVVVERWPECILLLLCSWIGDFACFKCDRLMEMAGDLLDKDIMVIRFLSKIWPEDETIKKLANDKVKFRLIEHEEFDPVICNYFTPNDELLDAILFSGGVELLEPNDSIIDILVKRIENCVAQGSPSKLAKAAATIVEKANIDPISITVSPIDQPIFCYEFWSIIGLASMNSNDLCFLLNAYIECKFPWVTSLLYIQNVDWKVLPPVLWNYVKAHPELAKIAHSSKLTVALACICASCNLSLRDFGDSVNGTTLNAISSERPPLGMDKDNMSKIIRCEWNETVPEMPNLSGSGEEVLLLRSSVAYLQHFLPVVEDFAGFIALAKSSVSSEDRVAFFLSLRLLSLISDAECIFDSLDMMNEIVRQIINLETIPVSIEHELSSAFRIGRYLTPVQFEEFALSLSNAFSTKASSLLARQVVPLISFFNRWDIIEKKFDGKLNLNTVDAWHLVTRAFLDMPNQKRLDIMSDYTSILPPLLSRLRPTDPDFLMLISAFPSCAMSWYTKLTNKVSRPLIASMEASGTAKVFKVMASSAEHLELQCTKIGSDTRKRRIFASYEEDESSTPVKLELVLPSGYPFCQVEVKCEFGTESELCSYKVAAAIIAQQSIDAGIKVWHQFVTQRLVDAEPCTVCYSYLNDDGKCPKITCPTCGNKFHGKCLSTWFSKCLKPTCPYCASPWEEKKKHKKE